MKYRNGITPGGGGVGASPGGTAVRGRQRIVRIVLRGCWSPHSGSRRGGCRPRRAGALPGAGVAAAPAPKTSVEPAEPQPPVRISADAAEYFNNEGLVVFTGNVVAVQADSTIAAERMEVSFEKPPADEMKPAAGIGAPSTAQRISSIMAQKKVSFRQVDPETGKERYATGEKGVYDVEQRVVTLTGNPRLWEGKNVIVGDEMVFHLADKKVVVKGKVNLTVYPDDDEGGEEALMRTLRAEGLFKAYRSRTGGQGGRTSRSARARSSACSGRTAPARRPPST